GAGSRPASTTTAVCSPARKTTASPCPTSQATTSHSGGGQPGDGRARSRPTVRAAPAASDTTGRRSTSGIAATATRASVTDVTTPAAPGTQGIVAPGRSANQCASVAIHQAGMPATQADHAATVGASGLIAAATTPKIVAGATAGAASTLAGNEARLSSPDTARSMGVQAT